MIRVCVCGSAGPFEEFAAPTGLPCARCGCGVVHQATHATRAQIEGQYRGAYHAAADRHPGCIPYRARYDHDHAVAGRRLARYREVLNGQLERGMLALDVGAANGAFVDVLRDAMVDAYGFDPDPNMARRPWIRTGTIADAEREFGLERFWLVTYHDVLEHLVDPAAELAAAVAQLHTGGALIVDVPDCATPAGDHHFKAEHLWFFTDESLGDLFAAARLEVLAVDRPVPGKLVVYGLAR